MSKVLITLYPASREHPARVIDAAYVEQVGSNGTGRVCGECGGTTYGLSDKCGQCGHSTVLPQ